MIPSVDPALNTKEVSSIDEGSAAKNTIRQIPKAFKEALLRPKRNEEAAGKAIIAARTDDVGMPANSR